MGKAPAVIIIARHGARMDAEDSTWTENSPTPYDPPVSYGGWTQTRALGARIASLLHARDISIGEDDSTKKKRSANSNQPNNENSAQAPKERRRRHKVVLHTSPFLRCVQSSIAICAGMAQFQGNLDKFETYRSSPTSTSRKRGGAPTRSRTLDPKAFDDKYAKSPAVTQLQQSETPRHRGSSVRSEFSKVTVRVDACLGEWLSPDYFESITPPPTSSVMVSGAKEDLLRPSTPIQGVRSEQAEESVSKNGHTQSETGESSAFSTSELMESLPEDEASSSKRDSISGPFALANKLTGAYVPPTPTYAISSSQPIPRGYVAHAKEACTNIDFRWDSVREPQAFGDGGEHGEEWSSMHKRFRKGLVRMVNWYRNNGPDRDPQDPKADSNDLPDLEDDDDLVLVIMTHGAGCNALIGALTDQPVLLDVGMASLTMAVHKDCPATRSSMPPEQRRSSSSFIRRRRSSVDCGLSNEYDMKLTASSEHLRAGQDPLRIPQLQSPRLMSSIPENGDSESSGTLTPINLEQGGSTSRSVAAGGNVPRSRAWTAGQPGNSPMNSPRGQSPAGGGLWGSLGARRSSMQQSETRPTMSPRSQPITVEDLAEEDMLDQDLDELIGNGYRSRPGQRGRSGSSQRGLWGS